MALNIVRFGLGLRGIEGGIVSLVLAAVFTAVIFSGQLESAGISLANIDSSNSSKIVELLKPSMEQHADKELTAKFTVATAKQEKTIDSNAAVKNGDAALVASYVVTQLREALTIGCKILIPFLVIDLLVAHLLTLLGILQMPSAVVAFPLKLLLFIAVDGWGLLAQKLIG